MGIDMRIYFKLSKKPDEDFLIFANNLLRDTCPICEENKAFFENSDEGIDNLYEINTLSRFYGVGYERGPFIQLFGLCAVLEKLFHPYDITIYYHGDSRVFDESYIFDKEKRDKLLEYFCKNGEAPYRDYDYKKINYKEK